LWLTPIGKFSFCQMFLVFVVLTYYNASDTVSVMHVIKELREQGHLSQRRLAKRAGVSFRALQMAESDGGNPCLSTLNRIGIALGQSADSSVKAIEISWSRDPDSIWSISESIIAHGNDSWKQFLFEFVDAFRRNPSLSLVEASPVTKTAPHILALMASTVEMLCCELNVKTPWWTSGVGALSSPWFVAGVENLKASALVESPAYFRKRSLFVLNNFLERR